MHQLVELITIRTIDMRTKGPKWPPSVYSYPHFNVPRCYAFIGPGDREWWRLNLLRFPDGYTPCNTLQSECIPPMPQSTRDFLIDTFCRADLVKVIKASDANRDCLIRPYLGRRRFSPDRQAISFSLRNLPLHIDQMELLGLGDDVNMYAKTMADALSMMHWYVQIDANDVEFVLAPPRQDESVWIENVLGAHVMWLLDFDCCKPMAMDGEGVQQAVDAFLKNDPYYPRPGQPLWQCFRETYLHVSSRIIAQGGDRDREELPLLFIQRIERRKERDEQQHCRVSGSGVRA